MHLNENSTDIAKNTIRRRMWDQRPAKKGKGTGQQTEKFAALSAA
ncbi:hypothetical protein NO357_10085 [Marimonas arenosa]|uniref:Uncharacterized protein n=1 Tax=Marimonas arenosa TaxID=1795305 RepID=A0AAE4B5D9_9RHOB|nr:hypothetical protein [Marimonas arenosa]